MENPETVGRYQNIFLFTQVSTQCEVQTISYLMCTRGSTLESIAAGGIRGSGGTPPLPRMLYGKRRDNFSLPFHTVCCLHYIQSDVNE